MLVVKDAFLIHVVGGGGLHGKSINVHNTFHRAHAYIASSIMFTLPKIRPNIRYKDGR